MAVAVGAAVEALSSSGPATMAGVEMTMGGVVMIMVAVEMTMGEALLEAPSLGEVVEAAPAREITEVVNYIFTKGYGSSKASESDGSFFCEFRPERKNLGERPLESQCILCMPEYENFHVRQV